MIGIVPLANLPAGALERLVTVATDQARFALTEDDVQLGDTVKVTSTGMMYLVVDVSQLSTEAGYVQYTAGRAAFAQDASHADEATIAQDASWTDEARKVDWGNVYNKDSSYNPAPHKHEWADITDAPETWDASNVTMTGYTKKSGDVATSDSALDAIGKVEKKADDALAGIEDHVQDASTVNMTGYQVANEYTAVNTNDTALTAIEKVEKKAIDASNTADWEGITNVPSEFTPKAHDAAKVTSLATYDPTGVTGDVSTGDTLVVDLAKIENKATAGADERIPNNIIDSIVNGSYTPTA